MDFKKDTVKLQVRVQSWPFRSLQNSLLIIFETQSESPNSNNNPDCQLVTSSSYDSNENLNWYSMNVEGVEMYLQRWIVFIIFIIF